MLPGLVLFLATLALRSGSTNRHVRGRLLVSAVAFALHVALAGAGRTGYLGPDVSSQAAVVLPLLLAFGAINALVALAINPWRADKVPDRFPRIVQDTIVIGGSAVAAMVVLQDRVFAATAAGAVVVGLALQDTLGNFFAGLAIQIEKPFRVGHWVRILGSDGMVSEVTWRATKLRTKAGNFIVVPNSVLSKDTIVNYSEPAIDTRMELEVGVSYDVPPNRVKQAILAAIRDEPAVSRTSPPEVLLVDFAESAVTYRVRFWISDFAADERLKDIVRTAIYYALGREGIVIPFPIRTVIMQAPRAVVDTLAPLEQALARVAIFAALSPEQRLQIAAGGRRALYGARESIVRQGEAGQSMFVLLSGEAAVLVEPGSHEVARIPSGGFFGEMSLLTGAPRNATVRTTVDSNVLEITADAFREFVLADPAALEAVGAAAARRQAELDQIKTGDPVGSATKQDERMVDVIRRFFGF